MLLSAAATLAIWAFWLEPASLKARSVDIELPRWPAGCDGLSIALLADLHIGSPHNSLARVPEIVAAANALEADLVVIAGDIVSHVVIGGRRIAPEPIADGLAGLQAQLGVYAVLGNHDHWSGGQRIQKALQDAGIPVLEDRSIRLQHRDCGFRLVGVSDYWTAAHNIRLALREVSPLMPSILVTHNPDLFDQIPQHVDLTLAGHTHGGQVSLPMFGPPVVPSEFGQRFAEGHIQEYGKHMYVNPGIGTSILPVRFRVPPEVTLIRLRSGA